MRISVPVRLFATVAIGLSLCVASIRADTWTRLSSTTKRLPPLKCDGEAVSGPGSFTLDLYFDYNDSVQGSDPASGPNWSTAFKTLFDNSEKRRHFQQKNVKIPAGHSYWLELTKTTNEGNESWQQDHAPFDIAKRSLLHDVTTLPKVTGD